VEKLLLLVDDEPAILKSLERLFHHTDYTVLTAHCGYQALDIIREKPVSVVISDYSMPDLSGADLLAMAKTLRPDMYTIVLSGNTDQQSVIRSINEGGASKFVTKPWNDRELIQTVDDAYRIWMARRSSSQIPGLLNQTAFLQSMQAALRNPCLVDYLLIYLELKDADAIRQSVGVGQERTFIRDLTKAVLTDRPNSLTVALMDDGRLCVACPVSERDNQDPASQIDCLLESFPASLALDGRKYPIRFNVGYTVSSSMCHGVQELMKQALIAVNQASVNSDAAIVKFSRALQTRSSNEMLIKNSLHYALERDEFSIRYQPKIRLADWSLCGAEALLRWKTPELGDTSPSRFIPLAESSGVINDIGAWVLKTVTSQWMSLYDNTGSNARVSINVSSLQLADRSFVSQLTEVINSFGINPALLELELTETAMMSDVENTTAVLRDIRSLGVKISVDDFGTGYSSLNYLNRLPLDIMKIDRAFICPVFRQSGGVELVKNMICLGRDLGLEIVAEGVEKREQLDLLQSLGCDVIQGYYFSRPLTPADYAEYTHNYNNQWFENSNWKKAG